MKLIRLKNLNQEDIESNEEFTIYEKEKKFIFLILDMDDNTSILISYPRDVFMEIFNVNESFFYGEESEEDEFRSDILDIIYKTFKNGIGGFINNFSDSRCGIITCLYTWNHIRRLSVALSIPAALFDYDKETIHKFILDLPEDKTSTLIFAEEEY